MDSKNKTMELFLHPQNTAYLKSIMSKNVKMEYLADSMYRFVNMHITEFSNYANVWHNVRYLNRIFISEFDPLPNTRNQYSAFGEADFMTNQVHTGDTYYMERRCRDGAPYKFVAMPNDMAQRDPIYKHGLKLNRY